MTPPIPVPQEYWNAIGITLTNALLGLIGYGLRQTYKLIRTFVTQHEQMYDDLKQTMLVVDMHTEAVVKAGWAKSLNMNIPRLDRRSELRKE